MQHFVFGSTPGFLQDTMCRYLRTINFCFWTICLTLFSVIIIFSRPRSQKVLFRQFMF